MGAHFSRCKSPSVTLAVFVCVAQTLYGRVWCTAATNGRTAGLSLMMVHAAGFTLMVHTDGFSLMVHTDGAHCAITDSKLAGEHGADMPMHQAPCNKMASAGMHASYCKCA